MGALTPWTIRPTTAGWKHHILRCSRNVGGGSARQSAKRATQEEIDKIVRLRRDGMMYRDIAIALGTNRTEFSVSSLFYRYCKKHGLEEELAQRVPLSEADLDEMRRMRIAGDKWRSIASRFGKSSGFVMKSCQDLKHRPQARPWTEDEVRYLMHQRDELKLDFRTIGANLNRSWRSAKSCHSNRKLQSQVNRPPKKTYSDDEIQKLVDMYYVQKLSWQEIAKLMPDRSISALKQKLWEQGREPRSHAKFTPEEDRLLRELRIDRRLSWEAVGQEFPNRSIRHLQKRFHDALRKHESAPSSASTSQAQGERTGARSFSTVSGSFRRSVPRAGRRSILMRTIWTPHVHLSRPMAVPPFRTHRRLVHTESEASVAEVRPSRGTGTRRPYSDAENALILRWRADGQHSAEIATDLGRSLNAVNLQYNRLQGAPNGRFTHATKKPVRPFTEADKEFVLMSKEQGKTYAEIEAAMDRRSSTICYLYQKLLIKNGVSKSIANRRRYSVAEIEQLSQMVRGGKSFREISQTMGRILPSIRSQYRYHLENRTERPGQRNTREPWGDEELQELVHAREVLGLGYKEFAARSQTPRSWVALREAYVTLRRTGDVSNTARTALPWTEAEDALLWVASACCRVGHRDTRER